MKKNFALKLRQHKNILETNYLVITIFIAINVYKLINGLVYKENPLMILHGVGFVLWNIIFTDLLVIIQYLFNCFY